MAFFVELGLEKVDPEEIPSRERRERLGVEIARSHHQRRDYPATLHWLETATRPRPTRCATPRPPGR
jgi:hypothetical protein